MILIVEKDGVEDGISNELEDFINRLLTLDPKNRLGTNGVEEVKNHPFFDGINWDDLDSLAPPFKPDSYLFEKVNPVKKSCIVAKIALDFDCSDPKEPQRNFSLPETTTTEKIKGIGFDFIRLDLLNKINLDIIENHR